MAYLLPLIQRVWEAEERGDKESGQVAVVVPTQDLAVQVLKQARQLCDGGPLTCADAAGEARGSHVLVGTPSTMVQCLGRSFRDRPGELTLVLDEADMLLSGVKKTATSSDRPVVKLLDGVKPRVRSAMRRAKLSASKPKVVQAEAGGRPAKAAKAAKMRPGDWTCPSCSAAVFASKDACFKCGEAKPEEAAKPKAKGAAKGAANLPHPSRRVSEPERAAKPEGEAPAGVRRDKPAPPPAQLVLVSATVPAQGGRSVGNYVAERFPTIRWLRSEGAHRPLGRLSSEFVDVADRKDRQARLLELAGSRTNRTMVFANTVAQAAGVARLLTDGGIECGLYHPDVLGPARRAALATFAKDELGVLVCSGLGGRGIDVDKVGTVVQYTLATNMVEYMHRVGRTARAGRSGHAINLVNRDSAAEQALIAEVQRCESGDWKFV